MVGGAKRVRPSDGVELARQKRVAVGHQSSPMAVVVSGSAVSAIRGGGSRQQERVGERVAVAEQRLLLQAVAVQGRREVGDRDGCCLVAGGVNQTVDNGSVAVHVAADSCCRRGSR